MSVMTYLWRDGLLQSFSERPVPVCSLKYCFEGMCYAQNRLPYLLWDGCPQVLCCCLYRFYQWAGSNNIQNAACQNVKFIWTELFRHYSRQPQKPSGWRGPDFLIGTAANRAQAGAPPLCVFLSFPHGAGRENRLLGAGRLQTVLFMKRQRHMTPSALRKLFLNRFCYHLNPPFWIWNVLYIQTISSKLYIVNKWKR